MADDDYRIRISTVPGDGTGVSGAVDGLEQLGDKADETGLKLNNALDNRRAVTHALRGFMEMQEGGTMALAGIASEGFVATEALEGMLGPLAPFLMTLTLLASIGIPMFERMAQKTGDVKTATEDLKTATGDEKTAVKDLEDQATKSYGNILKMLQDQTAELLKQVAAQKDLQRARDEMQDAVMAGKIANLDDQEQKDLAGKSESEQASIKRDYEKKRIALRQQEEIEKANQEVEEKKQAAQTARQAVQDQKNQAQAEQLKLTQAYSTVQGGAAAGVQGIKSDAQVAQERLAQLDDKFNTGLRELSPEETVEREDLQKKVPQLQQQEAQNGPDFSEGLKQLQAQMDESRALEKDDLSIAHVGADGVRIGDDKEAAQHERENQARIAAAIDAINEYNAQMKAAQDVIKDSVPKFQQLNNGLPALLTKAEAATAEVQVAQQKVSNLQTSQHAESMKLNGQQAREIAKEEFEKREAGRAAQSGLLEAQLKNPSLDAPGRARLQQQIEDYKKAGDRDQLDHSVELGLPDAEIIKLKGEQSSSQVATSYTAQAEAQRAQQAGDKKDASDTGRDAESFAKSLGASKQQAQEVRSAVTELEQGHAQGAALLESVLTNIAASVKGLTSGQSQMYSSLIERLREVEQELRSHKGMIDSLSNTSY